MADPKDTTVPATDEAAKTGATTRKAGEEKETDVNELLKRKNAGEELTADETKQLEEAGMVAKEGEEGKRDENVAINPGRVA